MTLPEWFKPAANGALVGGIFVAIVGFSWGGWMTSNGATKLASDRAKDEVVAALVPVCVDMARSDTQRVAKLDTIRAAASSYKRRDAVMDAGWATMPGAELPDRDLASACIEGLNLDAS